MVYDIPFPAGFDLADSVQPEPVMSSDGHWYFTAYGKMQKGAPALTYMCRWTIGQAVVEFVTLEAYTSARGSPASDGARLWLMAHDAGKRLRLQVVPDWTPLPIGAARLPVQIPPNGAIAALWHGEYTEAEFDTPEETALRVEKQLKALNELVDLLQQGGVLIPG